MSEDNRNPEVKTPDEKKFDEIQEKREENVKPFHKRLKWYHILVIVLLLFIISLFVIWHLIPRKRMNVVVLDKTVLSYSEDENIVKDTVYRKHRGFFWIIDQQRWVKPDGTRFDYKTDYFGPMLNEEGAFDHAVDLGSADGSPDFLYLADCYGLGNDTYGRYNGGKPLDGGITDDDMSYISFAHESGAPIVGEATLFSSSLSDSARAQLSELFGVSATKWIGRYIVDLQDFTDVPDWAPPMYEQQEGVEWRFTGPGILLVSSEDKIIILEQNTDFNSKNLLTISINEEYKKEFSGIGKCNFYNWFELIEPNYGVENIATFEFDLNATGMEKIKDISKSPRFCAITRRQEEGYSPVYFFAGDFNDYVSGSRYGEFVFANTFFRLLSYDRQGDISNFFWRFYNPLIRHILDDVKVHVEEEKEGATEHGEISRINNGKFQIKKDESWQSISLKAISVNATEPGKEKYSRDFTYYESLIGEASELGVNVLEAKVLMPPEFYAAIRRHNKVSENEPIYILQRIGAPEGLEVKDYLTDDGLGKWKEEIEKTLLALHGDTAANGERLGPVTYFIDISSYLLGITIDPGLDSDTVKAISSLSSYNFDGGDYAAEEKGARGFAAYLYDTAEKINSERYGYLIPAGVSADLSMLDGASFVKDKNAYSFDGIAKSDAEQYFFCDIMTTPDFVGGIGKAADGAGARYKTISEAVGKLSSPAIISGISYSSANAVYKEAAVTESDQGESIVDALDAVKKAGLLGATVYDLNDDWSATSSDMEFFSANVEDAYLWHNVCDSAQTTGIVALDSVAPEGTGLSLSDDDLVEEVRINSDSSYLYVTLQLFEELDFKANALFVGFDTYQRNDGEYYYSKDFTPNSLSGMEYSLRFDGKQNAVLYVTKTYDRTGKSAYTKESYTGDYSRVATLTYGGFSSGDNQFYQTGSTVYIRLPWTWLNVTDPAKKLVINDEKFGSDYAKTVTTNGVLLSVMIGERKGGDLIYGFPADKHDPGYKVYKWDGWEKVEYTTRRKDSFDILKNYFTEN